MSYLSSVTIRKLYWIPRTMDLNYGICAGDSLKSHRSKVSGADDAVPAFLLIFCMSQTSLEDLCVEHVIRTPQLVVTPSHYPILIVVHSTDVQPTHNTLWYRRSL